MAAMKLSRRQFLQHASLLAAGGLVAACSPAAPPAAAPATAAPAAAAPAPAPTAAPAKASGVTIRFLDGWSGSVETNAWNAIMELPEYKEAMGDNKLERNEIGQSAMVNQLLTTAIAGGDPPDTATNYSYLTFMARDMLLPLDPLVQAGGKINKDDFLQDNWNEGVYKGKLFGVPAYECFLRFALVYNTQLVETAGLDPNTPPETWSEVMAWQKKLTQFDKAGNPTVVGIHPYGTMGAGPWCTSAWMVPTSWNWPWFDEKTGKFDLNNPKMVESFNVLGDIVKFIGQDKLGAFYSVSGHDNWGGAYNAGIEACTIQGYWTPGMVAASAPDVSKVTKASWLPVPDSRKGAKVQGAGGHLFTILKGSKNPELTFKLLPVVLSKGACDAYFQYSGFLPATKSYLDSFDYSKTPGLDFFFKSYKETTEWHGPLACEITDFVYNEYTAITTKVNTGDMTPEQAADELQKRCETEYKNQGFTS